MVVEPFSSITSRQYPGEALVTIANQPSKAMADQIMAADKSRLKTSLKTSLGLISKKDKEEVEQAILMYPGIPK